MNKKSDKYEGMIQCPVCKKEFLSNPSSIYKMKKGTKIVQLCSYTCWRKVGGDR